ncbi:DUF6907 domain-containing protein [Streptomyces lincolnensis]|uniref:DUF6907 domain-containing protein n=1 Tax=Streptomyces lincolnensis TaxID=1915 RepID=UPI0037D54739
MATKTAGRSTSTPQLKGCPSGCDGEHSYDCEGNFFHRGPLAVATVPKASAGRIFKDREPQGPCLTAHLVVPDGPEFVDEPAHIAVDGGDLFGRYAELDADQAGEFIENLKAFTAQVELYCGQLAALKGARS